MNYHLLEAANGILAVMYSWMFVYGLIHIQRCYVYARNGLKGKATVTRAIRHLYANNKPEIALVFIVGNLVVRTWLLWYLRFIDNRNFQGWKLLTSAGDELFILTTFGVAFGIMCWVRVISPLRHRRRFTWFMMIFVALAFGFGTGMIPR